MPLTTGVDHIALLSRDLDRLIAFYVDIFDATVRFDIAEGTVRHAAIDVGGGTYLHAFDAPTSDHATGKADAFRRGHLDHVSLTVEDEATFQELRRRLVEHGASDGSVVDWGLCREVVYADPDGCVGEISIAMGEAPRTYLDRGIEPWSEG